MTEIHSLQISTIDEADVERWLGLLTPERRRRLESLHFREDFLRSLAAEAMLRILVGTKAGVPPHSLQIARPEGGKPFLPDFPTIHFNISHAGDWAVCAISDGAVGVDVEQIKEREIKTALLDKVLSESERAHWRASPSGEKAAVFYRCWTMKEAYAKCVGRGLGLDFTQIETGSGAVTSLATSPPAWLRTVDFVTGYALAVCTLTPGEVRLIRHCGLDPQSPHIGYS